MRSFRFILRSLVYFRRTHVGVVLAAAVATASLVGALVVGDSVRATLRHIALQRLGKIGLAVSTGDRYFTERLAMKPASGIGLGSAPALELTGTASAPATEIRAAGVRILGVDRRFWSLSDFTPPWGDLSRDRVVINEHLSVRLGAKVGDTVVFRLAKPGGLSHDMALGGGDDDAVTLRLQVAAIAADEQLGRFSLKADQAPPLNAFVPLSLLREETGLLGRANVLLNGDSYQLFNNVTRTSGGKLTYAGITADSDAELLLMFANQQLKNEWKLVDVQAELRALSGGVVELRSERVFIDPPIVSAAGDHAQKIATYFVNELRAGEKSTPYSVVTAFDPKQSDLLPDDMAEDEIVLTQWLADDLAAKVGDEVALKYYVSGEARKLTEHEGKFRVKAVVPTEAPGGDRQLMPDFPGLTDAETPLDWNPPADLNIDLNKIRKKDEAYWKQHRGAPKAFVSLAWAEKNWATRFGTYTALRWKGEGNSPASLERQILNKLDPAQFGLVFRDVRTPALKAAEQGYDFGQLFIGFSFFLMHAALLLTALMFAFSIEQRTPQVGLLLAMGYTPGRVRRLFLGEGFLLATVGGVIGLPLGIGYTKAILWGLANLWSGATGLTKLRYEATWQSLAVGFPAGIVMALLAMAWVLWRQARQPARALMAAKYGLESSKSRGGKLSWVFAAVAIVGAVVLGATADGEHATGAFFGAGGLLLVGGLFVSTTMLKLGGRKSREHFSLARVGWRNSSRRRGRSLATVTMLACGTFLLVAVNAFRHDPNHAPESATLGFELFATTSLPIYHDLNTEQGRDQYGLTEKEMRGVRVVQMRLLEGDEASCLNLNRPQTPPLLGVDPTKMGSANEWQYLKSASLTGATPALVDSGVAQWVLHKKVGDTIGYSDDEGRPFQVRIAGTLPKSVLQGYLVADQSEFISRFPSQGGYRVFLIDAPPERVGEIRKILDRALADVGITTTTTVERLAMFSEVENTYLSIFGVLGGLGILVGCVGLALVVLRNILERRRELAAMRAMGFEPSALRRLLLAEHWALVAMGLACGLVAALVAVAPSVRTAGRGLPYGTLAVTLAAIAASALIWTAFASRSAAKGSITDALRNE